MLKAGADLVYSVDVGYGQLDYSLRNDSRVVVMERRNARSLEKPDFDHWIDFVTADLSFISVLKIYGTIKELFPHARGIILIKPQFEAEKGEQKKGVVREKSAHVSILTRTVSSLREMGMGYRGLTFSPVKGPAGNIEFLLYFDNSGNSPDERIIMKEIDEVVESAHDELAS
jgi:23S rRNA (cytidine1920-2'-O)/16S rRNA (cytidine1409-2'-O)-methyltransferase